jgi:hypothetical protein
MWFLNKIYSAPPEGPTTGRLVSIILWYTSALRGYLFVGYYECDFELNASLSYKKMARFLKF